VNLSAATSMPVASHSAASPQGAAVEAAELTFEHIGGRLALDRVRLSIANGERVAIIGPSGAGKTSLLRLLSTALRPSGGSLHVLALDPWTLAAGERKSLRARIGLIHQAPPLPPRQRVVTAVLAGRLGAWTLARSLASLAYPADIEGARAALARLDLADRVFDRCDRLSGGQAQRVGVARVLYQQAELMLADEPVSSLDPTLADHTVRLLCDEAVARGVTLIASLHAVDLALAHFPRIVGLRAGRVAFDLPTAQVTRELLDALYEQEAAAASASAVVAALPRSPVAEPRQCD
jgi:phosphonate transport system ATP-binding protein